MEARELCTAFLKEWQEHPPAPSPRAAFSLYAIAAIFEKTGAFDTRAFDDAEFCARHAVRMLDELLPGRGGPTAEVLRVRALGLLGNAIRQKGLYALAEPVLVRATELAEVIPAEQAVAWNNLGMLCKYAGWFARGEQAYDRALKAAGLQTQNRDMLLATIYHNIGGIRHAAGDFTRAEEPARKAWEIRRGVLDEDATETLADAVAWAAVLDGLRRYQESRVIYERALAIYEERFGPEHYEVAATLHNLAIVELSEGNRDKAIQCAQRSFDLKLKLLGAAHPDTALSGMNLASMLRADRANEAHSLLRNSLTVFENSLAPDHPHTARCRHLLSAAFS